MIWVNFNNSQEYFLHFGLGTNISMVDIGDLTNTYLIRGNVQKNKPKMAYSRDLLKMARQQCGIMDWNCCDTWLEIEADMVWFGMD